MKSVKLQVDPEQYPLAVISSSCRVLQCSSTSLGVVVCDARTTRATSKADFKKQPASPSPTSAWPSPPPSSTPILLSAPRLSSGRRASSAYSPARNFCHFASCVCLARPLSSRRRRRLVFAIDLTPTVLSADAIESIFVRQSASTGARASSPPLPPIHHPFVALDSCTRPPTCSSSTTWSAGSRCTLRTLDETCTTS